MKKFHRLIVVIVHFICFFRARSDQPLHTRLATSRSINMPDYMSAARELRLITLLTWRRFPPFRKLPRSMQMGMAWQILLRRRAIIAQKCASLQPDLNLLLNNKASALTLSFLRC